MLIRATAPTWAKTSKPAMTARRITGTTSGSPDTVMDRAESRIPSRRISRVSFENGVCLARWLAGVLVQPRDDADLTLEYQSAVEWIQAQVESDNKYLSDDTRFWVDVQAI